MHSFFSRISRNLPILVGIGFLTLIFSAVGAFTSPSQNPPEGNVASPVTTSTNQIITGMKLFNPIFAVPFLVGDNKIGVVSNLNSDKLDGLNAADILAQSAGGASLVVWGTATCPSGWASAYSGEARIPFSAMYAGSFGGTGAGAPICVAPGGENIQPYGNESFSALFISWATGNNPANSNVSFPTTEFDVRRLFCAVCVK